jgi:hypothetical protein
LIQFELQPRGKEENFFTFHFKSKIDGESLVTTRDANTLKDIILSFDCMST